MLIILPTWVNLLLKAYAFIGIFSVHGSVNHFFDFIGIGPKQILFTDFSFLFVATYIEIPFMIMPIFNALEEMNPSLISASRDLGANSFETFRRVIFPSSLNGVKVVFKQYLFLLFLYSCWLVWLAEIGWSLRNGYRTAFLGYTKLGDGFYNRCDFNHCYVYRDAPDRREEKGGRS